jgi:hypothetical protein
LFTSPPFEGSFLERFNEEAKSVVTREERAFLAKL